MSASYRSDQKGRSHDAAQRRGAKVAARCLAASAILCGGIMSGFAAEALASDRMFILRADGDPGTTFHGECRLETAHGEEVVVVEGGVPQTHELRALGVSCRFTNLSAQSLLTIEISRGGSHGSSVSRTSSRGRGTIALSVR